MVRNSTSLRIEGGEEVIIGKKEFESIVFTNKDGEVLAVALEEEIIEHEGYKVMLRLKEEEIMELKDFATTEIVEELKSREGVRGITVDPYEDYSITTESIHVDNSGPTVILEITD